MLLRLIAENFLSFRDAVQFDMFPNRKRSVLDYHVYEGYAVPVLKMAALYGANGAGKSNLVKALEFIRDFATDKHFLINNPIRKWRHALLPTQNVKPVDIAVEFMVNPEDGYIYTLSVSENGVESECLYLSGLGVKDSVRVFERRGTNIEFDFRIPDNILKLITRLLKKNPNSSFLAVNSEFPVLPNQRMLRAYEWLKSDLVLIDSSSTIPALIQLLRTNEQLMEFTDNTMRDLCLGISSVDIETEDAEEWMMNHADMISAAELDGLKDNEFIARMDNERQSLSAFSEKGVKKVARFIFNQFGADGYVGKMEIGNQSDGTVRLMTLLPALYDAIFRNKTVVIDEINHQMHPSLIIGLVKRFATDLNSKGQLIFTTHETAFLEEYPRHSADRSDRDGHKNEKSHKEKLIRNDEIWFVEKKDGNSRMYSLNDFKFHNTLSVRNAYLGGRFGAYPTLGLHED